MGRLGRLLAHPPRVFVKEKCTLLRKENSTWEYTENEEVIIPTDPLDPNIDPYVFHQPWFYGYCRNANIPKTTSPGSIIIFGTFVEKKNKFLVDTVFTVNKRYDWLGKEHNHNPSDEFRNKYKYKTSDKWYRDFIYPRVVDKQHTGNNGNGGAKSIFESKHATRQEFRNGELDNFILDPQWGKTFSFIPLNYENGCYKLIDIYDDIVDKGRIQIFEEYKKTQNRLYIFDSESLGILKKIIDKSNVLVLNTSRQGAPTELDMGLQKEYYNVIYDEHDNKLIKKHCEYNCKYNPEEDDISEEI